MSLAARNRLWGLAIALVVFAIDQGIKYLVVFEWELRSRRLIELVPFFDLRWTENRGVSLGLFEADSVETRWILVGVTALIALVVTVWMMREKALGDIIGLGLILGGALGNIRDRYSLGYVIDYADLHIGEFRPFLIFNIADAAITIGVLIILARSFFLREKKGDDTQEPAQSAAES